MFRNFGGECSTLGNYLMKVYLEKGEYYPEIQENMAAFL